jgi:O-methyltransferase
MKRGISGDLLEAGVWQGGASVLMKAVLTAYCSNKKLYCCDSYKGLPPFTNVDQSIAEEKEMPMDKPGSYAFAGGVETVKAHFKGYGLLDDNVHFIVGYFNDTLPKLSPEPEKLALLRMDGDMYSSTMDILNNLYDRVVVGGYVIIDDYGHWPQCRRAVHDFFEKRGQSHVLQKLNKIDYTGVWFEKPEL